MPAAGPWSGAPVAVERNSDAIEHVSSYSFWRVYGASCFWRLPGTRDRVAAAMGGTCSVSTAGLKAAVKVRGGPLRRRLSRGETVRTARGDRNAAAQLRRQETTE